jgi:hypothetical protein
MEDGYNYKLGEMDISGKQYGDLMTLGTLGKSGAPPQMLMSLLAQTLFEQPQLEAQQKAAKEEQDLTVGMQFMSSDDPELQALGRSLVGKYYTNPQAQPAQSTNVNPLLKGDFNPYKSFQEQQAKKYNEMAQNPNADVEALQRQSQFANLTPDQYQQYRAPVNLMDRARYANQQMATPSAADLMPLTKFGSVLGNFFNEDAIRRQRMGL